MDVEHLSAPKLKSNGPYNSNQVADHHNYAQSGNGLRLTEYREKQVNAWRPMLPWKLKRHNES